MSRRYHKGQTDIGMIGDNISKAILEDLQRGGIRSGKCIARASVLMLCSATLLAFLSYFCSSTHHLLVSFHGDEDGDDGSRKEGR